MQGCETDINLLKSLSEIEQIHSGTVELFIADDSACILIALSMFNFKSESTTHSKTAQNWDKSLVFLCNSGADFKS